MITMLTAVRAGVNACTIPQAGKPDSMEMCGTRAVHALSTFIPPHYEPASTIAWKDTDTRWVLYDASHAFSVPVNPHSRACDNMR